MVDLRIWRWRIHWQIAAALVLGVGTGFVLQLLDPRPTLGVEVGAQAEVTSVDPAYRGELQVGDTLLAVDGERVTDRGSLGRALPPRKVGKAVEVRFRRGQRERATDGKVAMSDDSSRAVALRPFDFVAELFLRLLQMLIVPLIVTSLVTGVTSLGNLRALGRMGLKTFLYYMLTSFLAVLVGLLLVNVIRPGWDAILPLRAQVSAERLSGEESLFGVFLRMVPRNVFAAVGENGRILQVIFFSLLFGAFVTQVGGESGSLLRRLFQAGFDVMMKVAQFILQFIPVGVFALIIRVVGASGLEVFVPLTWFMLTVLLALVIHAGVVLPLLLHFVARVNPLRWAQAVMPALMTAFSTSSSSITLPETMRSVQERGKVSNRTSSFVLPLGATINMDGTALYECVGVIFLAQYYASTGGFELTFTKQAIVVVTALLASVGAAGIPSAGLVMMTTILSALKLPLEGVVLLLAIDRPLDMLRTSVNIWSDTTCSAVVARSEGERDITGSRAV